MLKGACRNTNGTSYYGDSCEYLEPILKCSKKSISLHIEALNDEKYSRLVFKKLNWGAFSDCRRLYISPWGIRTNWPWRRRAPLYKKAEIRHRNPFHGYWLVFKHCFHCTSRTICEWRTWIFYSTTRSRKSFLLRFSYFRVENNHYFWL